MKFTSVSIRLACTLLQIAAAAPVIQTEQRLVGTNDIVGIFAHLPSYWYLELRLEGAPGEDGPVVEVACDLQPMGIGDCLNGCKLGSRAIEWTQDTYTPGLRV
ncbi:uncharacterized protein B0H18DRAFT_49869 [Fomitopsis serialis]|uniref:uncharacterized protein n=1 Tax=Fomitopsis serialis TaxID=139415 RepID=UPI0020089714|nr:uncharacterized protein B0H18DRAFT_49869 [Neoantrodia serialis]KAH9932193.1 hypothetical protein B0H18DRAFT_49869 [Neoantrodia serialis]